MNELRNPLERAHNHGSAHDGVGHWWAQRFSAILLVVLTAWLIWALATLVGADHAAAAAFLAHPFHAVMAILFVVVGFYHGQLGLQVVIEDYVHQRALEVFLLVAIKALALFGGLLGALAILKLALGV
ncbi:MULTISPECIES: succinate dehydrogenase, hydrophobic membrane anchor protein [unclassified Wenzhouxiangella]|uniref:succinate dehydrogenase, hydrophobic membrane anchor protein n=1 Tax=unclassified Wenzhouxiangella TaxID=2613841 RepID=UPI001C6F300E|nr:MULTISPECIES: succinate dehydrogenase, hydrophobic membrane anchor protein [unclassified Wenzhouxiangella]